MWKDIPLVPRQLLAQYGCSVSFAKCLDCQTLLLQNQELQFKKTDVDITSYRLYSYSVVLTNQPPPFARDTDLSPFHIQGIWMCS